jgi:hypothetical protein
MDEGVGVFKSQQVSGFVQFKSRVAEIIASHGVTSLIKDPLIAGA